MRLGSNIGCDLPPVMRELAVLRMPVAPWRRYWLSYLISRAAPGLPPCRTATKRIDAAYSTICWRPACRVEVSSIATNPHFTAIQKTADTGEKGRVSALGFVSALFEAKTALTH